LATVEELLVAYNEIHPDNPIRLTGIPPYDQVRENGIGKFLRSPP
jgi:hypothetical protein